MPKIISTKTTRTKNKIKGQFLLSDRSRTKFEIDRKTGDWYQWGNSTENLCISVAAIENLAKAQEVYDCY